MRIYNIRQLPAVPSPGMSGEYCSQCLFGSNEPDSNQPDSDQLKSLQANSSK